MRHNRKTTMITVALICCLVLAAVGLYLNRKPEDERIHVPDQHSSISSVQEPVEEDHGPENAAFYQKIFTDKQAVNPDYK